MRNWADFTNLWQMSKEPQGKTSSAGSPAESHLQPPSGSDPASDQRASDVTTDFHESSSVPLTGSHGAGAAGAQTVADYRLQNKLGEGGMGRVYRALDSQGRAVAIKLLSQRLSCSDEALQRFKQEGYIASQINHPHCVFVHRVDEDRGIPFIAMELMTGKTLKDLVQTSGAIPYREAVRLILQCIDGLIEAHRRGMIHRDIKPANCYLDEQGNVKIGDFGLARSLVDDSDLTRRGAFLGTPLFASPEQLLGEKMDERSDIYSLTATLYYLLAGRAPFESPNAAQVIAKIASSDPPAFKEVGVQVPAALEALVMHGLARDRDNRFESFPKMQTALTLLIEPDRELASMPRRVLALFLDTVLFMAGFRTLPFVAISVVGQWRVNVSDGLWHDLGASATWFLYLWLFEWWAGETIGKRLARLKVVDRQSGRRPRASQALIRAGFFVASCEGLRMAMWPMLQGDMLSTAMSLSLGMAAMMATWRMTGYTQLTQDWLSGTETCLSISRRTIATNQFELPFWKVPVVEGGGEPQQLGRFAVSGRLGADATGEWLLGQDLNLERQVWIHWQPVGSQPRAAEHPPQNPSGRMRIIESGVHQGRQWDAYLAPAGVPLCVFIREGGWLPWPLAYQIIRSTLALSESDHLLLPNDPWKTGRHWLDSAGRLTIAVTTIELVSEAGQPISNTQEGFLAQLALAALPVKHPLRRSMNSSRVRGRNPRLFDLPSYKGLCLLERLATSRCRLSDVNKEMDRLDQTAEQVTAWMRTLHVLMVIAGTLPLLLLGWYILYMNTVMLVAQRFNNAQQLAALRDFQLNPNQFKQVFDGLSDEDRSLWTSPEKLEEVERLKEQNRSEIFTMVQDVNRVDFLLLSATAHDEMLCPYADLKPDREYSGGELQVKMKGFLNRSRNVKGYVASAQADAELWKPVVRSETQGNIVYGLVEIISVFLIVWTGVTRGGLTPAFSGVAIVQRDGRRMSMLRAGLRAALLIAPFLILPVVIFELESCGVHWLWLAAYLKITWYVLPLVYVVGAIIWPQIGPHDRVFNTVAVPR